MSFKNDLILWNSQWRLQNSAVICRACNAVQPEMDKALPFCHLDGCWRRALKEQPWNELDRITALLRK